MPHAVEFVFIVAIVSLIVVLIIYASLLSKYKKREALYKQLTAEITVAFAKVIDIKDHYTNGHSFRVARYTAMLTRELGYSEDVVERYYNIALLHDVGKIGIPEEILNKPDRLTPEEFKVIQAHTYIGSDILMGISCAPDLLEGAEFHHERPDGKGYPRGLKGNEIPRVAQIIAVADTFDTMYSNRPYRQRMNFDRVLDIIKNVRGTQLTEDVVDALFALAERGELKAADDIGGGATNDIDNINWNFKHIDEHEVEHENKKE